MICPYNYDGRTLVDFIYTGCPCCDTGYLEDVKKDEVFVFDFHVRCVCCGFQINAYTMAFSWETWDSAWF